MCMMNCAEGTLRERLGELLFEKLEGVLQEAIGILELSCVTRIGIDE